MDAMELLREGCNKFNISIDEAQVKQFIEYKRVLLEWNQKMNLTAIEDEKEIIIKHFLDSISCLLIKELTGEGSLIDVGTGAGFPGIPIKVMYPGIKLTLLDSLNKRIRFLQEVGNQLGINDISYVHGRAEDMGQNKLYREQFDYAVARAVASLNVLTEYCLPFVSLGGYFICLKGPQLEDEMKEATKAIGILGGVVVNQQVVDLPFSDISHRIVVIKKTKQTPTNYPRKAGKPTKEPII